MVGWCVSGMNDDNKRISVEVVYAASPQQIWRRQLEVQTDATVAQALEFSGIYQAFPSLATHTPVVGIFGRRCALNHRLSAADRIEVYRPLVFDPMESRRRRIRHRQRQGTRGAS